MTSVHDVASYLIAQADKDGNLITHLKLQKLCYYAQGYSLALMAEPMFSEPIEAWEQGPIVRTLHDEYQQYRGTSIPAADEAPEIEPWRARILDMINQRFGWMSLWELRNRTHSELPWQEAWCLEGPDAELDHDAMRDFFRASFRGQRVHPPPVDKATVLQMLEENDDLREATARGRAEMRAGLGIRWSGRDARAI